MSVMVEGRRFCHDAMQKMVKIPIYLDSLGLPPSIFRGMLRRSIKRRALYGDQLHVPAE
jgi:hypothetical protein